jgi:cytochrome bd-type quinol oxidase subunit 2
VGRISDALTPFLGMHFGRLLFSAGVLGASTVAAIVCSLGLAWGIGEVAGHRRADDATAHRQPWFLGVYTAGVVGSALLTWSVDSLVWLNIAAQVANAVLLPVLIGTAVLLAATVLEGRERLRGWYLWLMVAVCGAISAIGLVGAAGGL